MSDLMIVKVIDGVNIRADLMNHLQKEIIKQKETGVIVLPWFLTAVVVPRDIEIKMESEDKPNTFTDKAKIPEIWKQIREDRLAAAGYPPLPEPCHYKAESEEV